jgi:hypothetical protein
LQDAVRLYKSFTWTVDSIFDFQYYDRNIDGKLIGLATIFSELFNCKWEKEEIEHEEWKSRVLNHNQVFVFVLFFVSVFFIANNLLIGEICSFGCLGFLCCG